MKTPTRNRRRRLLSTVVLALATGGISAPSAQGAGGFPVWPPDARVGEDRATRAPAQVVKPDGFDWGDAGVGAGASLAAALLAGGAILAARDGSRVALRASGRGEMTESDPQESAIVAKALGDGSPALLAPRARSAGRPSASGRR